jgi:hypothetical protein
VPTIAEFLGLRVTIFYRDHPPMHVHVTYQSHQARFLIETGELIDGSMPQRQRRLVKQWIVANCEALTDNWGRAERREPLERLEGL